MTRKRKSVNMPEEWRFQGRTEHSARCHLCRQTYDPTHEGEDVRCGLCTAQPPLDGLDGLETR